MNRRFYRGSLLLLLGFVTGSAFAVPPDSPDAEPPKPAETEGFSSERPGFTNGTETVPKAHFQLETGLTYSFQQGTTARLVDDGAQFRYGLSERSEVRIGLPNYGIYSTNGQKSYGWDNTSLSGKLRFLDESAQHPALALIAGTFLPVGSPDTSEHYFQPSLDLELSRTLTERYTLQANAMYNDARNSGVQFHQYAGGLNLGLQVTPEVATFIEVYRVAPTGAGGAANGDYLDAGVTLVRLNRWQFDVNGGIGLLHDVNHDYFMTTGLSRRW
jgi:hypothetical protein